MMMMDVAHCLETGCETAEFSALSTLHISALEDAEDPLHPFRGGSVDVGHFGV